MFPGRLAHHDGRRGVYKVSYSDLGHNHDLLTGEVELFDGFAEYDLRGAIRVHLPNAAVRKGGVKQMYTVVLELRGVCGSHQRCRRFECRSRNCTELGPAAESKIGNQQGGKGKGASASAQLDQKA